MSDHTPDAETTESPETSGGGEAPGVDREMILELNFVPEWARKPPATGAYFQQRGDTERPRRDARRPGARPGFGPGGDGGRGRPGGGARPTRDAAPRGAGGPGARPDGRRREAGPRTFADFPRPAPPPALSIRFLPDERQLASLIKRMRGTGRAYPVAEIVSLFLSNPDACRVKIESAAADQRLWQCQVCGMVTLDRPGMDAHLVDHHLDEIFDREEQVGEPPTGNFVCVARCGLSGTLLGPPNHNTYTERVLDLHRTRFAHMSLSDYKRHIETLHEPEEIERWKEASRTQVLYRRKGDSAEAPALKANAALELFQRECAPKMMRIAMQASLPAVLARKARDARLTEALSNAWDRECRYPRALPLAIQGALRGRRFHIFRAGRGERFVTSIAPVPLDPARAIPAIRDVLTTLREHPGCTRPQLLETLHPGATPDSAEAADVLKPLGWLIERGHILEFYNGTLAVPLA